MGLLRSAFKIGGSKTLGGRRIRENSWYGKYNDNRFKNCGVNTIGQLKYLAVPRLESLVHERVKKKALASNIAKCSATPPDSSHINTINHRKHDNPYQSKYPLDHKERIKQSSALKPFVVITDLVLWIMKESQRLMMGTVHEKYWYFYHDTLSPMTAEDTLK